MSYYIIVVENVESTDQKLKNNESQKFKHLKIKETFEGMALKGATALGHHALPSKHLQNSP